MFTDADTLPDPTTCLLPAKKGGERVTEDFVPVDANNNPNVEKYVWGVG